MPRLGYHRARRREIAESGCCIARHNSTSYVVPISPLGSAVGGEGRWVGKGEGEGKMRANKINELQRWLGANRWSFMSTGKLQQDIVISTDLGGEVNKHGTQPSTPLEPVQTCQQRRIKKAIITMI